jgi:hypothetical protein
MCMPCRALPPEKPFLRHRRSLPPRRYRGATRPTSRPSSSRESVAPPHRCRFGCARCSHGLPLLKLCTVAVPLPARRLEVTSRSALPSTPRRMCLSALRTANPSTRPDPRRASDLSEAHLGRCLLSTSPHRPKTTRSGPASWLGHRTSSAHLNRSTSRRGLPWCSTRGPGRSHGLRTSACLPTRRDPPHTPRGGPRTRRPKSGPEGTVTPGFPDAQTPSKDTFAATRVSARSAVTTRLSHPSRSPSPANLFRRTGVSRSRPCSQRPANRLTSPAKPKPRHTDACIDLPHLHRAPLRPALRSVALRSPPCPSSPRLSGKQTTRDREAHSRTTSPKGLRTAAYFDDLPHEA